MCQCGCRGWCTLFPLLMFLAVDLLACALGGYNHVPENLLMHKVDRDKYGVLAFLIAIIEIRTDWPAWCEVIGVRFWRHAKFPCPKCDLPLTRMLTTNYISQLTLSTGPWRKYGQEQYLADVEKSTVATCFHLMAFAFKHCRAYSKDTAPPLKGLTTSFTRRVCVLKWPLRR